MSEKTSIQDGSPVFGDNVVEMAARESMRPIDKQLLMDAEAGKVEDMASLIQHGADVNAAGVTGWTPLMYAASYNYPASLKLLLTHTADLDRKNNRGQTAYEIALALNNTTMAEAFLKAAVDRNTVARRPVKVRKPLQIKNKPA